MGFIKILVFLGTYLVFSQVFALESSRISIFDVKGKHGECLVEIEHGGQTFLFQRKCKDLEKDSVLDRIVDQIAGESYQKNPPRQRSQSAPTN